jgi:hypothetical protein
LNTSFFCFAFLQFVRCVFVIFVQLAAAPCF